MPGQYYQGVGRRKNSTARARVFSGDGSVTCNDRPGKEYFSRLGDLELATAPLKATGTLGRFSVTLKISGGGNTGQTGAAQMAIARALLKLNPEYNKPLRKGGYLTRDDRMKERKKPGLKRARKAPTFTKR
jgi:small subunit ribosomal protein S9